MSRKQVENDNFIFAFGVDHWNGAFLQIWDKTLPEEAKCPCDTPEVDINCNGIRVRDEFNPTPKLLRLIQQTQKRFEISKENGILRPNLDAETVCRFRELVGFDKEVDAYIYRLWD